MSNQVHDLVRFTTVATAVSLALGLSASPVRAEIKDSGPDLKQPANDRDIQLVFRSEIVGERQTSGAVGELTFDEALTNLLTGTGLIYQYLDDRAVTTVPMSSRSSSSLKTSGPRPQASSEAGAWERLRLAQAEQGSTGARGSGGEASERRIAKESALEEITVTSSRIQRDGFQAPTPTTMLGAEQLAVMAPHNIADAMNQIPSIGAGLGTRTNGVATGSGVAGFNSINLHSLGIFSTPNRTLVLLDGRRIVGSRSDGLVNINTIPQQLVDRVEVVTGGASAAYGSDAVAGVVNFILKKDFTGLVGDLQAGVTGDGDAAQRKFTAGFGQSFARDRGHLLLSAAYSNQDGVDEIASRDWYDNTKVVANAPGATPALIRAANVNSSLITAGGLIIQHPANGPLQGTQFGAGGTPSAFQYGAPTAGGMMIGGQHNDYSAFQPLAASVENRDAFLRLTFDVSDTLDLFAEGSYDASDAISPTVSAFKLGNLVIQQDNAFLPDSIRTQMINAGLTSVLLGTWNGDIGKVVTDNSLDTYRGVLGANWRLGGTWVLNSYYQYGRTDVENSASNNVINPRYNQAIDAVRDSSGNIVCRNPANGCVPLNIIGMGVASQAAIDWVTGNAVRNSEIEQHVVATTLQGEPFSSWAGPVSIATGAEYRKETVHERADDLSLSSSFALGNFKPVNGSYDVKEAFLETVVPLAKDLPFARSLEVNAAVRATDYSMSGSVTTWKVGATWRPVEDLLFRAVRSRDIRAPSIPELFSSTSGSQFVTDPFNGGRLDQITTFGGGNPNLTPELADNWTAGLVYSPRWLSGFNVSIDYYRMDMDDAITQPVPANGLAAQSIMNLCFSGLSEMCTLIERDSTGHVSSIHIANVNAGTLKTSGLDVEVSYQRVISERAGAFALRALFTRLDEFYVDTGTVQTEYAGQAFYPDYRASVFATYSLQDWNFSLSGRHVSEGVVDNSYRSMPTTISAADNKVPSITYLDAALSYRLSGISGAPELYVAVDNVLNKAPPHITFFGGDSFLNSGFTPAVNMTFYDTLGTTYRAGVRLKF